MAAEEEFSSIKELYERVADTDTVSYDAFLDTLHRLAEGNVRTQMRVGRQLGIKAAPKVSPFVAYDGEGWGDKFVLLGNSLRERIVDKNGLSTIQCLEMLAQPYDQVIKRVFFSFGYDVNHILRNIPNKDMEVLVRGRSIMYEGYRISYNPGKILRVNGFEYYDVFSFFSRSFLKVVELMLGKDAITQTLIEGKSGRGKFEEWDLDKIIAYNDEELDLLVQIMDKLRAAFIKIGVDLKKWYGPGAVANYWFREHEVLPKERHSSGSLRAVNAAYFGGRFEQIVLGKVKPVWEYDIKSAYPSVMADMPHFRSFRKVSGKKFEDNPYSLWHITFDLRGGYPSLPSFMPLPIRSQDGRIAYPMVGKGWYWYNEIKVMLDNFPKAVVTYHEGYIATIEGKPFSWVRELYDYRKQLKAEGDLAEYAIKVGLNSLYGKTAQRVGNNPFFSLAWASYITSCTRAKIAAAAYQLYRKGYSNHVIGFATDAVFTDRQLRLPISSELGDWDESSFSTGYFYQSGVYRLVDKDGVISDRYRGNNIRRGIDDIETQLREHPYEYPIVKNTRFISNMLAIIAPSVYGPKRLQFVTVKQQLKIDAPYKRFYTDFTVSTDFRETKRTDGLIPPTRRQDYGRLLRMRIESDPKVTVDDNVWWLSDVLLHKGGRGVPLGRLESYPPPMKDANSQRLLEEAERIGMEVGPRAFTKLAEELDIMEDEFMD